jgi:methylmalonyl-CoA/ethylmalonyl-CoA epimerase
MTASDVATAASGALMGDLDVQFDHTAHAAPSLRDLLPIYVDLLGGEPVVGADNTMTGFRVVQLRMPDGSKFELIEPLCGSTFLDSFFARTSGRGGLHHVTFLVDSVDRAAERVQASGLRTMGHFAGSESLPPQVFIHPSSASGALVQLVQRGFPAATAVPPLEEVLAGRGLGGNGIASPPASARQR